MTQGLSVHLLASGSRGNCSVISCQGATLVVDAGLSAKQFLLRLEQCAIAPESIAGIVITHEHTDHVLGVGPMARKLGIPVFATEATLVAISDRLKDIQVCSFAAGDSFQVGSFSVYAVPITHDAADPVCFVVNTPDGKVAQVSDLGIATRLVADRLRGARVLLLESNHDEDLLMQGSYPWATKQRIKSRHGHLSNLSAADLLEELLHEGLDSVALVHLSESNNEVDLALSVIRSALEKAGRSDIYLTAGHQDRPVTAWPPSDRPFLP